MATDLVAKMGQNYLPPALIVLLFRNGMGYHNRNVRVNSVDDACILCKNFMKFGPVTPELTLLICERHVRHGQKTGIFRRISPDILDRFCLLYTSPSPRDRTRSRMPSSA